MNITILILLSVAIAIGLFNLVLNLLWKDEILHHLTKPPTKR